MTAWYAGYSDTQDARDPAATQSGYTANNVGYVHSGTDPDPYMVTCSTPSVTQGTVAGTGAPLQPTPVGPDTPNASAGALTRKYPTVTCTSGGPVPGGTGVVTIFLPRGAFANGGFRSTDLVIVRPYNQTDTARFGDLVTNIASTDADTEATFRPATRGTRTNG